MPEFDDSIGEQWHQDFQGFMHQSRENGQSGLEDEFGAQQEIYTKYAENYDNLIHSDFERYVGFNILANAINENFADKSLRILDFGCGTGLLGQALHNRNFKNIDGSDCNSELLKPAADKGCFKNLYCSRGTTNLPTERVYDIICSSGTFFLSRSHPCTEAFPDLLKLLKRGGTLIILTKKSYLNKDYVDWSIVKEMLRKNIIEEVERVYIPGYRKVFEFEEDRLSMASILHYRVLQ
ncbi:uncharacterized protein LOC134813723 isoform X2 [Bolinopsis microptera]